MSSTKAKSGLASHVHHDKLFEWCTNYDERVEYIKENKPIEEQEVRLRLFRIIPLERLPVPLVEARAARDKAGAAYEKARAAWEK